MLVFLFVQCTDNSSVNAPESQTTSNVVFNKKQQTAANLAKVLAYELQKNDKVRQEVFAKISTQIDGDFEVPLDYLNPNTLGEIENTAKELKVSSSLNKNTSNFGTVKEIKINELENNFNNLQIAMPYAARWTDNEIKANGGLIVAYYPFGVQDTEIRELVGYNKNGEKVIITKETAPNIPYVILSENERKMILDKISPSLKNELKNYSSNDDAQWQNKKIDKLKTPVKDEIKPRKQLIDDGGLGGSGGGSGGSGHTWGQFQTLILKGFSVNNISNYEPYWTNGEPEFEFKMKFVNVNSTTNSPLGGVSVYLDSPYNGWTGFFYHNYRTGWVYGNYWSPVLRDVLQPNTVMHFSGVEQDTGDLEVKFNVSINVPVLGQTLKGDVKYQQHDDVFGAVYFSQNINFPKTLYVGDLQVEFDTE